jgi:hypothetical protein
MIWLATEETQRIELDASRPVRRCQSFSPAIRHLPAIRRRAGDAFEAMHPHTCLIS